MKALRIIFLICFLICFLASWFFLKAPKTSLLEAFLPQNSNMEKNIVKLSKISNNQLNIILEANNKDDLENLKVQTESKISFLKREGAYREVVEIYKKYPTNFLTEKTRELLEKKDYKTIENKSLTMLYDPLGFFVAPIEKDPFLFASDYVLNIANFSNEDIVEYNGKFYSLIRFECNDIDDISNIKNILNEIEKEETQKIYLSGAPIHTFETQKNSKFEINIICLLSTIFIVFLCYFSFGSIKILIPILSSILFGILFGFSFCALIFKQMHILTFVFSTTLIGISLDYSLHYFLSDKDNAYKKSLLTSLLTTILTFGILYFSNIELLKQISVFVSFGLVGVYLFVLLILPLFKVEFEIKTFKKNIPNQFKKAFLIILAMIFVFGMLRLKFDDDIKNIYKPNKELLKSETIFMNVFAQKPEFVLFKGNNVNEILKKEEKFINQIKIENIKYLSLANFISSKEKQKENLSLVNDFYKEKLNGYANFLDKNQKEKLLCENEIYDVEKFNLNDKFMLDNETSFIMLFKKAKNVETLNISNEITKILKNFRMKCLTFAFFVFFVLYGVLRIFYPNKKVLKIIFPSFLGGVAAIAFFSLFGQKINAFHLLSFVLILGFSMDYAIFRINGDKKSGFGVLISCLSTTVSFLLLGFTSFKLISLIGLTVSIGIFISYILTLVLISQKDVYGSIEK